MKTHHILTLAFVFAFTAFRAQAGKPFPVDRLNQEYWQGLDPKTKIVFLTAYRHAKGPNPDENEKPDFRDLKTENYPALAAKLDQFYKDTANKHVFVSAAIGICYMEMSGKPQADIDKAIKEARDVISQF